VAARAIIHPPSTHRMLLDDLAQGCLTSPYPSMPKRRRIWYLEELAARIEAVGGRLFWAALPPGRLACCDLEERIIYLSPTVYTRGPVRVRELLTHELVHVEERRTCEDWIRIVQWQRYVHLLFLEYLAA
jgi:hypothetical protein